MSTTDTILKANILMEKYRGRKKDLFIAFLLEEAFDRISRKSIWQALGSQGVPELVIAIIQDIYHEPFLFTVQQIEECPLELKIKRAERPALLDLDLNAGQLIKTINMRLG